MMQARQLCEFPRCSPQRRHGQPPREPFVDGEDPAKKILPALLAHYGDLMVQRSRGAFAEFVLHALHTAANVGARNLWKHHHQRRFGRLPHQMVDGAASALLDTCRDPNAESVAGVSLWRVEKGRFFELRTLAECVEECRGAPRHPEAERIGRVMVEMLLHADELALVRLANERKRQAEQQRIMKTYRHLRAVNKADPDCETDYLTTEPHTPDWRRPAPRRAPDNGSYLRAKKAQAQAKAADLMQRLREQERDRPYDY